MMIERMIIAIAYTFQNIMIKQRVKTQSSKDLHAKDQQKPEKVVGKFSRKQHMTKCSSKKQLNSSNNVCYMSANHNTSAFLPTQNESFNQKVAFLPSRFASLSVSSDKQRQQSFTQQPQELARNRYSDITFTSGMPSRQFKKQGWKSTTSLLNFKKDEFRRKTQFTEQVDANYSSNKLLEINLQLLQKIKDCNDQIQGLQKQYLEKEKQWKLQKLQKQKEFSLQIQQKQKEFQTYKQCREKQLQQLRQQNARQKSEIEFMLTLNVQLSQKVAQLKQKHRKLRSQKKMKKSQTLAALRPELAQRSFLTEQDINQDSSISTIGPDFRNSGFQYKNCNEFDESTILHQLNQLNNSNASPQIVRQLKQNARYKNIQIDILKKMKMEADVNVEKLQKDVRKMREKIKQLQKLVIRGHNRRRSDYSDASLELSVSPPKNKKL